jgi:hypothetical protein
MVSDGWSHPHMGIKYSGWYSILMQIVSMRDFPFVEDWMDLPEPMDACHRDIRRLLLAHEYELLIGIEKRMRFPWYTASCIQDISDIMDQFQIDVMVFGLLYNIDRTHVGCLKVELTVANLKDRRVNNLRVTDGDGNDKFWVLEDPDFDVDYIFFLHPEKPSSLLPNGGYDCEYSMLKALRTRYVYAE